MRCQVGRPWRLRLYERRLTCHSQNQETIKFVNPDLALDRVGILTAFSGEDAMQVDGAAACARTSPRK